jgi:hypothetical protein
VYLGKTAAKIPFVGVVHAIFCRVLDEIVLNWGQVCLGHSILLQVSLNSGQIILVWIAIAVTHTVMVLMIMMMMMMMMMMLMVVVVVVMVLLLLLLLLLMMMMITII